MPASRWEEVVHPDLDDVSLDDLLHALADPARRAIVRKLADEGDRPCGTFGLGLAASTLSHHFRMLREAGIIRQYDEGRRRMNTLRADALEQRFPGVLDAILASDERPHA